MNCFRSFLFVFLKVYLAFKITFLLESDVSFQYKGSGSGGGDSGIE